MLLQLEKVMVVVVAVVAVVMSGGGVGSCIAVAPFAAICSSILTSKGVLGPAAALFLQPESLRECSSLRSSSFVQLCSLSSSAAKHSNADRGMHVRIRLGVGR